MMLIILQASAQSYSIGTLYRKVYSKKREKKIVLIWCKEDSQKGERAVTEEHQNGRSIVRTRNGGLVTTHQIAAC
jgi:hypothetical protein